VVHFRDPDSGRKVTIVDTPGFDDSRPNLSNTDILKKITDFLLEECVYIQSFVTRTNGNLQDMTRNES